MSNIIPIKPQDPPDPPKSRDLLEPVNEIFDRLYTVLAELDVSREVLCANAEGSDLVVRAANCLHNSVRNLESLYTDFDSALITVKNALEPPNE